MRIEWGEMTSDERSDVMLKARWNAREKAPDTEVPQSARILAVASGKGGVGKSSVTVNLAAAVAAKGFTVGVLDADIWGFSVPRLLGIDERLEAQAVEGSDKPKIIPNERRIGDGLLKVVSTGFMVDEDTALMWRGLMLTKAVEQFLRDVHWGELDYLFIDMPPGTGDVQMGLARLLPRTDLLIVTTPNAGRPEGRGTRRRHGPAQLPARRRGDREHERVRLRPRRVVRAVRRRRRPGAGRRARRRAARPGAARAGRSPPAATPASRWSLHGDGPAAEAFRVIAERIVTDVAPAVNMAGCSARVLSEMVAALEPASGPTSSRR